MPADVPGEVPPAGSVPERIDDCWLRDWVNFGMVAFAGYLTSHAAFAAFCESLEEPASGG